MKNRFPNYLAKIAIEAGIRTFSKNGQDFVENAIDVAFEPLEGIADFLDNLFGL